MCRNYKKKARRTYSTSSACCCSPAPYDFEPLVVPKKSGAVIKLLKSSSSSNSQSLLKYKEGPSDVTRDKKRSFFEHNLMQWKKETAYSSVGIFENSNFRNIVGMGVDAVPYIGIELQKGDTYLVHALDCICPGVVEYEGYVPLKEVCSTWRSILSLTQRKTEIN